MVDVEKQGSKVLHTFPVKISAPAVEEEAFKAKALEAAGNAKLVPNEELESLNAKMHVSRGGQLTPTEIPTACWRRPKRVWTTSFASVLICSGSRRDGRRDVPATSGIKHSMSALANAPTPLWERGGCPEGTRTSTSFEPATLKRADGVAPLWPTSSHGETRQIAHPNVVGLPGPAPYGGCWRFCVSCVCLARSIQGVNILKHQCVKITNLTAF